MADCAVRVTINPQNLVVQVTDDTTNVVVMPALVQVNTLPAPTTVTVMPPAAIQVTTGGTAALSAGASSIRRIFELERVWRISSLTAYRVLGYTGSRLDTVDVWDTSGMGTKFFERVLSYTGANLTETVTTNLITGEVLTATLTYSTGKLATVTKVIT